MTRSKVIVVWHDAHSHTAGWEDVADIDDAPCVVETVGWLIPDAKQGHLVIAQSWIADSETIDSVLSIPVGMVQSVQLL